MPRLVWLDLWMTFEDEVAGYLAVETPKSNLVDSNARMAAEKLRKTDLKAWSRFLVSDYSKKIGNILREAVPVS